VERAHQTLQDRLVKELRLRAISDRDGGNAFLEGFRKDYNRRFARAPKSARDAHRALLAHEDLLRVFSSRRAKLQRSWPGRTPRRGAAPSELAVI
jgi:hypothetical protein